MGCLVGPGAARAQREYAEVPKGNADHSQHIIDCDVFGWNKEFTEVGVLASDIVRGPKGKQRGELFVLIYPIEQTEPTHNVHVLFVTQADQPHDPMPIADVRSKMWAIGYGFENMWPRRPRRKHFRGAMYIDLLWDKVEVDQGVCQPAVGFMLTYRNDLRYQPHQLLPLRASCDLLNRTDTRTYWAKEDLGVVMVKFDYSVTKRNEISTRLPVSAAWSLAKTPRLRLRSAWPKKHAKTAAMRKLLHGFGDVVVEHAPQTTGSPPRVTASETFRFVGRRLLEDTQGVPDQAPLPDGTDMLVQIGPPGPDQENRPLGPDQVDGGTPRRAAEFPPANADRGPATPRPDTHGSEYIDDWAIVK